MAIMDVDTIAAYLGGPAAQADWLDPKVSGHLVLFIIHQMNRMDSCNGCAMTIAQRLSCHTGQRYSSFRKHNSMYKKLSYRLETGRQLRISL